MRRHSSSDLYRHNKTEALLSATQESLWFIEQAHPGTSAYNVPLLLQCDEALDLKALRLALQQLTTRHDVLRTTYRLRDGRPVQTVGAPGPVVLEVSRAAGRPTQDELALRARPPFDLENGPPLRCHLWQGAPEGDTLLLTIHHIAFDGWSMSTLLDDLLGTYEAALAGSTASLPEPEIQYADYAAWERDSRGQRDVEGRATERAEELASATDSPLFPGCGPRGKDVRAGGHLDFTVPAVLWQRTGRLATRLRATPFVVLFAAYQEVLRRWSGATDFLVGTVMANRPKPVLEGVVGCFVNTVPLRCRPEAEMTFEQLCRISRTESFRALAYQDLPFDRLTALTAAKRGTGRGPLIEVAFGVQNMPAPRTADQSRWRQPELLPTGTARYDLLLLIEERAAETVGTLEYDLALCTPKMAKQFRDCFLAMLEAAVDAPETPLAALPMSSRAPGARIPGVLTGPSRDLSRTEPPADRTLLDLVAARLAEQPDSVAVSTTRERITRRELDDWSCAVSGSLGFRDGMVPVLAERGPALVAGWLGALRSGNAYVPLNLDTPAERLEYILDDLSARVVLADHAGADAVRRAGLDVRIVDLSALRAAPAGERRRPAPAGEDTAVVIYTSGTTGRPKAVPVPHQGLANTVLWWADDGALGPADRLLCVVGTAFDPATFETFRALVSGAELVFADDSERKDSRALLRLLRTATVASMTPSLLRAVLDAEDIEPIAPTARPGTGSPLRLLYLGGEKLTRALAAECTERWNVSLHNVYGPTEVSCTSLSAAVDPTDPLAPPIGVPIWNTRAYVLGPAGEELPPGVPGELYLAGVGVSASYLGRPGRAADAFLPDPFAPAGSSGAWMYRTGDRVAVRADGLVEYLGRADEQVKILGNRIEPAEVAALLEEQNDVVLSAAVAAEGDPKRLVAYVVLDGSPAPTREQLVRPLLHWLPAAVLPTDVYPVDALPRTANDKTDFKALRALRAAPLAAAENRPDALDPVQRWASERFQSALRSEGRSGRAGALAPGDDFFALGGHSLLAVRMLAAIEREFGTPMALGAFLEQPTVAGLARMRDQADHLTPELPTVLQDRYPASPIQQQMLFLDRVASQRAAYLAPTVVEFTGSVDRAALARALTHVLAHHPALRSRFSLDRDSRKVYYRTDGPAPEVLLSDWTGSAEEKFADHLEEFCWAPFDLAKDPPSRAEIAAVGDRTVLALVIHHIVVDGWAQQLLLAHLGAAYRAVAAGREPELSPAVHPGALPDSWAGLDAGRRAERTEALLARLRGAPTDIALPRDRERPPVQDTAAETRCLRLSAAATTGLRDALAEAGATLSMAAAALLAVGLAQAGDQRDFLFAFPWAGRETALGTEAVAMLVKTLVLRVDLRDDPTWRGLLATVREQSLASYQHADVPFEALVAELDARRGLSRPPVTPVLVTAVTGPPTVPDIGADIRAKQLAPPGLRIKYELELTLRDIDDSVEAELSYATALFDPGTINGLLAGLARAAERLADHLDSRVLDPHPSLSDSTYAVPPDQGPESGETQQ